jgi:hypothetical protein
MLSSSNYAREEGVLNSGSQIAADVSPEVLNDPNTKHYYHRVQGARFVMPDGAEIIFHGGYFPTNNPDLIKELDKVSNRGTSMIYTKEEVGKAIKQNEKTAADDAAKPAGDASSIAGGKVSIQSK